ncbi:uncharacterized protein LOC110861429 isoform X2 [Folsomia candida]|uniref:uncharacterized protein LOC110861429 isoform X2 n=1 Tax=Folsomia candida TaxID=158441 RepID=UPI001604B11E|nr:uncharacterized protein LOC110861429 isoform X2 [Folsomia candida]
MINAAVLVTVVLVGLTLLIGVSILLYQHYRYRRKSVDWGDIARYDTPLEIGPLGSNNSSFRSYKYSQLVQGSSSSCNNNNKQGAGETGGVNNGGGRKYSNSHLYPPQRPCLSLGDIERDGRRGAGTRSSTKSCPPGVYTTLKQEFRVSKEQQLVQPYYYYRQVVHPSVSTKARHSLPEVVPNQNHSPNASKTSPTRLPPSPQHQNRNLLNPYAQSNAQYHPAPHTNANQDHPSISQARRHKLSVDYCIEHVSIPLWSPGSSTKTSPTRSSVRRPRSSRRRRKPPQQQQQQQQPEQQVQLHYQHPHNNNPQTEIEIEIDPADQFSPPLYPPQSEQYYPPVGQRRCSQAYFPIILQEVETPQLPRSPPSPVRIHLNNQQQQYQRQQPPAQQQLDPPGTMLTHQSRSLPTGPPIPGARLNRTYSISSQGHIESAVRKVRAASLDINRAASPCPSPLGESNFHVSATQHSSHSMDAYPSGKVPMLSPNSLCVRRASRCLSPLFIPPISPKSPTDGNSSSSQPSASSTGPLSPMLGSLQLDLYLKKDITVWMDRMGRIFTVGKDGASGKKENGGEVASFPFPAVGKMSNGHHAGSLGRLHFRLKYDLDKSDLQLHVIEALDLAKGEICGFNDPYIRVFLSPEVDTRKRETSIHRNESNPFFDEHFKFPVSQDEIKEKGLMLQVLDNDKYSRTDVVGEVSFALEDFDITTNLEIFADIVQNKKPSGEKQEILISLSYLPSAERLTVVLLKARNLHPPDNKDTIDPFVKVYLLGGGRRQKKKKTTARKNSNDPVWNEAFTFSITSANLCNCSIEISVLDQSNDLMGSHALIGSCMLGPHQKGSELTHWTEMTHNLRQTISMWHVLT